MDLSDAPIGLKLYTGASLALADQALSVDLETVEIIERVDGPSVFSLDFNIDPSVSTDDFPLVGRAEIAPFARLAVTAAVGNRAQVLADGFVTRQELMPPAQGALGSLAVYGEDVGLLMDLEERSAEYVNLDYSGIARQIIGRYSAQLTPDVETPRTQDPTDPLRRTRLQHGTDRSYLAAIASRVGHLFYVAPGPSVGQNRACWKAPMLSGSPQTTLASSLLVFSPTSDLHLGYHALQATTASASVLDLAQTPSVAQAVALSTSTRTALTRSPAITSQSRLRTTLVPHAGASVARTRLFAQSIIDRASDRVAFATARLDVLEHGTMVRAGGIIALSGVGRQYGGAWYVRQVTHRIGRGTFEEQIELSREGWVMK